MSFLKTSQTNNLNSSILEDWQIVKFYSLKNANDNRKPLFFVEL